MKVIDATKIAAKELRAGNGFCMTQLRRFVHRVESYAKQQSEENEAPAPKTSFTRTNGVLVMTRTHNPNNQCQVLDTTAQTKFVREGSTLVTVRRRMEAV